jgi:Fe-S-cluster-containing dehydrogenase component
MQLANKRVYSLKHFRYPSKSTINGEIKRVIFEFEDPEGFWRNWIRPLWDVRDSRRTVFQPGQCMQCDTPSCVVTCPTRVRTFGDLHDPASEVSQLIKGEKLVRVNAPHVNTQPNIYYREGTRLLDWTVTPTLPGNVHMDRGFWEKSE